MTGFLCDGMMGHLARWLRLLGEDATYAGSVLSDEEILLRLRPEGPWLVTRDGRLHERAIAKGLRSLLIPEGAVEEQLALVLTGSHAGISRSRWFTRCTHCNGRLEPTAASNVGNQVPPGVLMEQHAFQRCTGCGKVYWDGTHVEAIRRVLDAVAARVG